MSDDAGSVTGLTVDGVILWDVEPAGDRVQARLTYRGACKLSTLRFKLDAGLIVRSAHIPGMVADSRGGTKDQPVWTMVASILPSPMAPRSSSTCGVPLTPGGRERLEGPHATAHRRSPHVDCLSCNRSGPCGSPACSASDDPATGRAGSSACRRRGDQR